jgi:hypothetical protein
MSATLVSAECKAWQAFADKAIGPQIKKPLVWKKFCLNNTVNIMTDPCGCGFKDYGDDDSTGVIKPRDYGFYGIRCKSVGKRLSIDVLGMNPTTGTEQPLKGTIPSEIAFFSQLTVLDLSWNPGLTGSIPPEIGQLTNLQHLNLYETSLVGEIPTEIGNMKALITLDLNANFLRGTIPSEIISMAALQLLRLEGNKLTGHIPVLPKALSESKDCVLSYDNDPNEFYPVTSDSDQCLACQICTNSPQACWPNYC